MMKRLLALATAATLLPAMAAAATLSGTFTVEAVNVSNVNSAQSGATLANFGAAAGLAGATSFSFTYTGDLDFRVGGPQDASPYSIATWLNTGTGSVSGLDVAFGDLQLSFPDINAGTATTTFFYFTLNSPLNAGEFSVTHDDGFAIFDDGTERGGVVGPVGETTTSETGFDGGTFSLLYVASNGNPSILEVDAAIVPVPASLPLLALGLGAFGFLRRRKTV